jgi:hypothetical protein
MYLLEEKKVNKSINVSIFSGEDEENLSRTREK